MPSSLKLKNQLLIFYIYVHPSSASASDTSMLFNTYDEEGWEGGGERGTRPDGMK